MKSNIDKINRGKHCHYCNCDTKLVDDKAIYGMNSTYGGMYYRCINNNDHYVGTYSDNITSLGRVADKELRLLKMQGHKNFDPLWKAKFKYFSSRPEAYQWLANKMGIDISVTHFGMFTNEQCKQAVLYCQQLRNSKMAWVYIIKVRLGL